MSVTDKIGCVIIMHPGQNNYGTSLQGFATIEKMRSLGADCEIIRYRKKRTFSEIIETLPGLLRSGAIGKIIYKLHKKKDLYFHKEYRKTRSIRTQAVNKFKKKYFDTISKFYIGYADLCNGSKSYSAVMVGSDQVWGPLSLYSKFYNLLFVEEQVPKFSYASSFGVSTIFPWQKEGVTRFLSRLDKIGVREQRGKEIVEELTNREASVVLDPTLLLTAEEWDSHIDEERCKIEEPYILTYVLGEREDIRDEIKRFKKKSNLKVVNLPHIDNYHKMDDDLGDLNLYDVDPFDFIRLVRDAKYIVTDSFHGTVFSILFHKKFVTFYRKDPNLKGSTHSRIDSILQMLGLSARLCEAEIYDKMIADIDYECVESRLIDKRSSSIAFLQDAVNLSVNNK